MDRSKSGSCCGMTSGQRFGGAMCCTLAISSRRCAGFCISIPAPGCAAPPDGTPDPIARGRATLGAEPDYSEFGPCGEVFHLPDATHWVQHDKPDDVNRLMVEFLSG